MERTEVDEIRQQIRVCETEIAFIVGEMASGGPDRTKEKATWNNRLRALRESLREAGV